MSRPIYLDYMATTPVDPMVVKKMQACLSKEGVFGNPASQTHYYGYEAEQLVKQARRQVARLINADAKEIIWTSGATESDNLAIKGVAWSYQRQGKHIITMSTEHKAVLDTCKFLASQGFEVTFLDPELDGTLDLDKLKQAIRQDTILISIMHVNNETGVIQDIAAIGKIAKENGVLFHVDAAQSAGKLEIDVQAMFVDMMSLSAHKNYGPKGMGALYIRHKPLIRLVPLIHGGGHERGYRSGTLATHQIVGMGEAFAIAKQNFTQEKSRIEKLANQLWQGLSQLGGIKLNGSVKQRAAHCLNISVAGVDGEALLHGLTDLAISTGSACTSASMEPSHVLTAMQIPRQQAYNALRISIGRFTTEEEIQYTVKYFAETVGKLRQLSPIWDEVQKKIVGSGD